MSLPGLVALDWETRVLEAEKGDVVDSIDDAKSGLLSAGDDILNSSMLVLGSTLS